MKAISIRVKGRVQGVGYRAFVRGVAQDLGLAGAVWNENDGSVSIFAQGSEQRLEAFLKELSEGPGQVDDLSFEPIALRPDCQTFTITYGPGPQSGQ